MEYLSQSELLAVLKVARADSLRNWLMLTMQFNHALRPSEVCAIKIDDIKNGEVTIRRLKNSNPTTQPIRKHVGLPLLDEARGLVEWNKERPHDSGSALFPSKKGGQIEGKSYHRIFQQYALKAGLPESKAHPHILRHTSITTLIRQGLDIAWVQVHAGHKNIGSTAIYTHLNCREVSDRANNAFVDAFKEI